MKMAPPRRGQFLIPVQLDVERRPASAGALYRWVVELEAGGFNRLHIIYSAAVQVHDGRGINEDLKALEVQGLVHHSGGVLERHRVLEAGAAATHHANTKPGGNRILRGHDLAHLGYSRTGKGDGVRFCDFGRGSCHVDRLLKGSESFT